MTETYPETGARIFLDLRTPPTDPTARYDVLLYLPGRRFEVTVDIDERGGLTQGPIAADHGADAVPPAWVLALMTALCRQVHRNKKDGPWQRRLMRWRPEPTPQNSDAP